MVLKSYHPELASGSGAKILLNLLKGIAPQMLNQACPRWEACLNDLELLYTIHTADTLYDLLQIFWTMPPTLRDRLHPLSVG